MSDDDPRTTLEIIDDLERKNREIIGCARGVWVATQGGYESEVLAVYSTLDAAKRDNPLPDGGEWQADSYGQWWNGVKGWRHVSIAPYVVRD